MMKKTLSTLFLLIFSYFISLSSYSSNYSFLADSAMSQFTDADAKLYMAAQNKALNTKRDGVKITWKNPESGAYGYMIPMRTIREKGILCRNLLIFNNAKGMTGQSTFKFCKINNQWKAFSA